MLKFIKFVCKTCGAEFRSNDWSWDCADKVCECPMCHKLCPEVKVEY